jgi:hypothetical protein
VSDDFEPPRSPLSLVLDAISAAEAGDLDGVRAIRARFIALSDQSGALVADRPDLVAVDPVAPFVEVFDVLEADGPEAAKERLAEIFGS